MSVSTDHRVSGTLIVAAVPANNMDKGPQLGVPDDLRDAVTVQSYGADGYLGSKMSFNDVDFDQFSELVNSISQGKGTYDLTFHTAGNLVSFAGSVDLTAVPAERADIQIKISFPGEVIATSGSLTGQTVTWTPKPGEATQLSATADLSGSSTPPWVRYAILLGIVLAIVVLLVGGLALAAHRRSMRIYRR